jgi:two-component system, NtrC family, sensor kinase
MRKILMIDDEEDIRRVLSMSLRSDGYHVVTAANGRQGVEAFQKEWPQIVLTDIRMPGMDGLAVLKQIKQLKPDAEVIIITGHGDIDSAVEALQYGASDFIHKPVKNEALSIALKRAEEKLQIRQQLQEYTQDLETMVKVATEEFERKSSFQAKLIRSSNDGIVASDEEGKIVIFNPGAEKIFGYKRAEVVRGRDARELFPPEVAGLFDRRTDPGQIRDELSWREIWVTSKSGEKIPVRFSGTVLREKNDVMGSVAFLQDLREIKRLERELVNSERLAAIGQTVAGMAHCIKNILHGFKGGRYLVDIGIDKHNTDKLIKGWQMIKRSIARTSDLVLDLLSYSKEREPEYEPCSPNEIANDVAELLAEQASDYEIEIVKNFSPSIARVAMDPRTVHRCLLNLVSNAIDACIFDENVKKHHSVRIGTWPEEERFIRFEVQDNGSGMSQEVTDKLFTAFFSTKGAKGTGLGLLVTCKLIEEHRGTIAVQSEAGQGTTFTMRLPYQTIEVLK